jgi:hypothetical protein
MGSAWRWTLAAVACSFFVLTSCTRPQESRGKRPEAQASSVSTPPVSETPELGSLALFGAGTASLISYALLRRRARQ